MTRQCGAQPAEETSFSLSEASGVNWSSFAPRAAGYLLTPQFIVKPIAKLDQLHCAGELELYVSVHLRPPSPPPIKGGNPLEQRGKKEALLLLELFCCSLVACRFCLIRPGVPLDVRLVLPTCFHPVFRDCQ